MHAACREPHGLATLLEGGRPLEEYFSTVEQSRNEKDMERKYIQALLTVIRDF